MHSLEVASTSAAKAVTPHEERAKAQDLMTTATKVATYIEGLLQSPASYPVAKAASSILISGSDMKAMIPSGSLSSLIIKNKDMSRVDYTGMSFVETQCTDCDLSRSIMLRVAFHQSSFVGCTFDGSIFKANTIRPRSSHQQALVEDAPQGLSRHFHRSDTAAFVGCSFKFCMLDVTELQVLDPNTGSLIPPWKWDRAGFPLFVECDFEFSDVRCRAACSWMFHNCRGVPAFDVDRSSQR
jgi:hypothetical protein